MGPDTMIAANRPAASPLLADIVPGAGYKPGDTDTTELARTMARWSMGLTEDEFDARYPRVDFAGARQRAVDALTNAVDTVTTTVGVGPLFDDDQPADGGADQLVHGWFDP